MKALETYLEEDIRFDISALARMNPSVVEQYLITGKKTGQFEMVAKTINAMTLSMTGVKNDVVPLVQKPGSKR